MIEVKNLTKKFEDVVAVNNVSFTIKKGEITGLLGPNGAGKTTTMRILTGYYYPTSGTATVAGFDILLEPLEVKRRIGYLPENSPLYLDMKTLDYLKFIAKVREIPQQQIKPRIEEIIETVGISSVVYDRIEHLSKGYRQRVGLAQTLIHNPEILILDEPTSGLDPKQIIEIRELIKKIGKEKTVILSTHILPEVEITSDRVLIINKGSIVASGTIDELSTHFKGNDIIYVKIKGPEQDITNSLKEISKIKQVAKIESLDSTHRYKLVCDGKIDLTEQVFSTVVKNNWVLKELYLEETSLEDIFLQLTTKE